MREDGYVDEDREHNSNMAKFKGNYFEGKWDSQYGLHDEIIGFPMFCNTDFLVDSLKE